MVLTVVGSVFIVLYRSRGLYQIERPIDIPDGEFQWPKGIGFMGKLPNCWGWVFVGLLITIALSLISIWRIGHL
jgi:hypothetical protein